MEKGCCDTVATINRRIWKGLGIILCMYKNQEQVELLELAHNSIHAAEFITKLPPPEVVEKTLHKAIEYAKARLGGTIDVRGR